MHIGLPWWPCGLRRCHWLLPVSHHCKGLNRTRGMWECCQWLGVRRWFAGYCSLLQSRQYGRKSDVKRNSNSKFHPYTVENAREFDRAIQWIPTWLDFGGLQKSLSPCALDESSISIGRINAMRHGHLWTSRVKLNTSPTTAEARFTSWSHQYFACFSMSRVQQY